MKNSGEDLKTIRCAPLPQPKARPIMHQEVPAAPKDRPMTPGAPKIAADLKPEEKHPSGGSNEIAAKAVRIASTPGKIDPRQQHY